MSLLATILLKVFTFVQILPPIPFLSPIMLILLSLSSIFSFLPFTTSMAFSDIIDSWMSRSHILVPISNTSLSPQPNVLTSLPTLQAKPPIPCHSYLSPHNDLDFVSGSPFPIPSSLDIR